jgi:hypothetical protein
MDNAGWKRGKCPQNHTVQPLAIGDISPNGSMARIQ